MKHDPRIEQPTVCLPEEKQAEVATVGLSPINDLGFGHSLRCLDLHWGVFSSGQSVADSSLASAPSREGRTLPGCDFFGGGFFRPRLFGELFSPHGGIFSFRRNNK